METLTKGKWMWYDVMSDLKAKGCNVVINPIMARRNSLTGVYDETYFAIAWAKDIFLLLTMTKHRRKLVDAFSDIVEYLPFAMRVDGNRWTFEWSKADVESRWTALQACKGLVRL